MIVVAVTKKSVKQGQKLTGICEKVMGYVKNDKVMVKEGTFKEVYREYVCSRLANLIDIKSNRVEIIDYGQKINLNKNFCSVHWWADNFKSATEIANEKGIDSDDITHYIEESDLVLMNFFDAVIDNDDRHSDNFGYVNNELFLIDHGLSHPEYPWYYSEYSRKINRAIKNPLVRPYVIKFAELTESEIVDCCLLNVDLNIGENNENYINLVIERFFSAQQCIRELLVEKYGIELNLEDDNIKGVYQHGA